MASDIELFARLAADIEKAKKAANTIPNMVPPKDLDAEKAGEKSEPDETETPPETETEPPETPATPETPETPETN